MRAIVQRVNQAQVEIEGSVAGAIGAGLLVYVGVTHQDAEPDVAYLADKISNLRIFNDAEGKMNRNVQDIGGGVLVISAFALYADARKGKRPSFDQAAGLEQANLLYEQLCDKLRAAGLTVATGVFRAHMHVTSTNDGPVSILLDSQRLF